MKFLLIVFAILFVAPIAHASTLGNDLSDYCATFDRRGEDFKDGVCVGYILGAKDGFEFSSLVYQIKPAYCIDDDVTHGQIVKVVVKYLKDHPERLQHSAQVLVDEALRQAFACAAEPPAKK